LAGFIFIFSRHYIFVYLKIIPAACGLLRVPADSGGIDNRKNQYLTSNNLHTE